MSPIDPTTSRVLTGDRPTGPLHLGHHFGTLQNRVRLQEQGAELFVLVADYQTITDRESPAALPADVDGPRGRLPRRRHRSRPGDDLRPQPGEPPSTSSIAPVPEPRERRRAAPQPDGQGRDRATGGGAMSALMFTYPVHQAADILFCRANLVPVGRDQLPHVELARLDRPPVQRALRRTRQPLFPEPDALLGSAPLVLGLDGGKMSKSRGNAIAIGASDDETARLIRTARTDSERTITYEPDRRPEVSNLLLLAALCRDEPPEAVAAEIGDGGATALKRVAIDAVNDRFRAVRARRRELMADRGYLRAVLRCGSERARAIADDTLAQVHALMHTAY